MEKNNAWANRVLRNANLFDIPYVHLESQKHFPISSFPRLWNEIIIPNILYHKIKTSFCLSALGLLEATRTLFIKKWGKRVEPIN